MELLSFVVCAGGFCLLFVLVLAVGAVAAKRQQEIHRRRVAALSAWARANGWTYLEADPRLVNRFQGEPFGRGYGQQVNHVLSGTYRGRQVLAFQYQFIVKQGKSSRIYVYTVVSLATPVPRPYLQVSHEHAGHKLLELVGVRDLQLESDEFNRVFRISTGSDKFAYDVLHPRMMEWLLADQRARTTPFRLEGNAILCWTQAPLDPRHVLWLADFLVDFSQRVPDFVWK